MTFQKKHFYLQYCWIQSVEDILINYIKNAANWILVSTHLVTGLLINGIYQNGTVCQIIVLTQVVLTVLKGMFQQNWNWKLYKLCMSFEIVALYGVSLCLFMPSVSSILVVMVNLVNKSKHFSLKTENNLVYAPYTELSL